ncbi:MAG: hypothetical protein COC01_03265 [Bacteroidetes bacterium]|nr:cupin domain-containing protein [Bacteroidia bacterium]PCH68682.1 MAG: hypothetical protein COC01_03265 [Bacteroidota bacterium]
MRTAEYWIEKLALKSHPEGGYYNETYRSPGTLEHELFDGSRNFSTAIHYMLESHEVSTFHRLKSDELMHFYYGDCFTVYVINDDSGELSEINLGSDLENGETFQGLIKAGDWFGAKVNKPDTYGLIGCTVAPGFDFSDFEIAQRGVMLEKFPQHEKIITKLTR